ncbi:MAG: UDP-N-acetylmuramate dehydrogenase [Candidatus Dormibacteraeota bacterium]|uniref:UDP-N-acetylenolpyruvoylglucosamine reductase n=1 Tax=Candidatus Amunia macphersoniae TaxID=3127014 RepID=A0A934KF41_9BACT|nr:UDP-N-acetylmuramate dehydrogenase [Candidatus Dormibacteraeota bacterium]
MSSEWLAGWPGVRHHEPLARHSQYGVGGPADAFLRVDDLAVLPELVARCTATGTALTILGAGSNALILDGGIRGLAVRSASKETQVADGQATLAAGTMMPRAALDLAHQGVAGMEWGIGVPGSCGASIWGNAGAFGGDVAGTLTACEVIAPDGTTRWIESSQCAFAYRDSAFKHDLAGHVVMRGAFAVSHQDPAAVRARTDAVQAERKRTQPYGVRSLGSTFKNPDGDFAGRLIEEAGLKGRRQGGAQISPKHANFILNIDHASAVDVLTLVDIVRDEVASRFGVVLEREIVLLGEELAEPAAAGRVR